jgi:tetratricopeptide (TPR) repeat protein
LNIRLAAALGIVLATAAGFVFFAHRAQSKRTADALLQKSNQADADGDRALALKYLEQYLSYRPDDQKQQAHFAVLNAELASDNRARLGAYFLLDRVLMQAPESHDIRRRLASLALELGKRDPGRLADAVKHFNLLLNSRPGDAEVMELLGRCHEATRKFAEAAEWYGKAVKADPARISAYARLAHLLRTKLEGGARADEMLDKMVAANPSSATAWLTRFRYREQFDRPGADDDLAKAQQLAPEDAAVLLLSGERAQRNGDIAKARRDLQSGVERYPTSPGLRLALAALEARNGRIDIAEECLEAGVEAAPEDLGLRLALIEARIQTGAAGKARAEIAALRGRGPRREHLDLLEAEIAINQKQWDQAADRLEHLLPAVADDRNTARTVNLALEKCYHNLGQTDREFAAGLKAAQLADDSPESWIDLVSRLVRANQTKKAEEATQRAGRLLTVQRAPLALARCYALLGHTSRASEYFASALAAQPGDAAILRRVVEFALSLDDQQAALLTLNQMASATKRTPEDMEWGRRTLLSLLAECRDYAALGEFRRQLSAARTPPATGDATKSAPDERGRALASAASRGRASRREAIRLMEHVIQQPSPEAEDRFLLACLYEDDRQWPKALDQLRLIANDSTDHPLYVAHLTKSLLTIGNTDEAAQRLERLRQREPRSLRTLTLEARLLKAQDKMAEAAALLEEYVSRDESQSRRISALLEEIGDVKAAEKVLRRHGSSMHPEQIQFALARFLGRQGRFDEALDCCESAASTRSPEQAASAMIVALESAEPTSRSLQRAERWLLRALDDDPDSTALNFTLASLRKIQGRSDEAKELYRKLVDKGDPTGLSLNNLAYLLASDDRRLQEASTLIDRAIVLHSPQPGLLDTRSHVSLRSGKTELAIDDLEAAVSKVPTALRFFRLADAYHTAHDDRSAREVLREAQRYGLQEKKLSPPERAKYRELVAVLARP